MTMILNCYPLTGQMSLFLLLLFISTFLFASEKTSKKEVKLNEITKNYGEFIGNKELKTIKDFRFALSPVPEALNIYNKSISFKIAAFVFLGVGILSYATGLTLGIASLFFSSIALPLSIAGLVILGVGLIVIIPMILCFVHYVRNKKRAIILYNQTVREINNRESYYKENSGPNLNFHMSFLL